MALAADQILETIVVHGFPISRTNVLYPAVSFGISPRWESQGTIEVATEENAKDKDKDCDKGFGSNNNGTSGNPVVLQTGNKTEEEVDFVSAGEMGLSLARTYNSLWGGVGVFGKQWLSNLDYKISFGTSLVDGCYPRPGGGVCGIGTNTVIWSHRPDGRKLKFVKNAADGVFYEDKLFPIAKIVQQTDGSFQQINDDNSTEKYSSAGYVQQVSNPGGVGWTYGYSGTYPIRVTHTSGRYIDLVWTSGQLTSVRDPAGNYYGYAYLTNRFGTGLHLLSATSRPGTPATNIAYFYEKSGQPGALTGKSIGGVRYSWFDYQSNGKAISTEHGGGRDRYSFLYGASADGAKLTTETNPLGRQTQYSFQSGTLVGQVGYATTHCFGTYREHTLDANGYDDIVSDFNGNLTDYDYDASGRLLKQVEASGTPLARTTQYVWDQAKNRVSSVIVSGQTRTDYTFNADNRISAVTLTNLSAYGVANQTRVTTYAYTKHPNGMIATITVDGPLAGSTDAVVTNYNAYGDLISVTNSLGHATTYSNHNGLGQPGRVTGPNGDVIDYVYDAQGRVITVRQWIGATAADTVTTYNGQGLVAAVTTPDGVATNYEYDSAQRLTRLWRTANGTVAGGASKEDQVYSYDLMGNVTRIDNRKLVGQYETQCKRWMTIEGVPECVEEQQVLVETPTITMTTFMDYDEAGRLIARRGNNGQNMRYAYDDAGNIKSITDSLNRVTTMAYDTLQRRISQTDPLNNITRFEYDAGDRVTRVIDPNGLHTTYVYDGFGQLWAQSSPDTGTSSFQYNASGQMTYSQRSDGSALSYAYDGLGRLTWYGTSTEGRGYSYDWCPNGKGRLCAADYSNGTRQVAYTPEGRISGTNDWTPETGGDYTGYAYDTMGRLTGISYPSGVSAGYGYSNGKLTTMTTTINGATQIVVGSINYQPFGGVDNWTYGNNIARTYAYDLDGRAINVRAERAANDPVQSLSYSFNANDEITAINNGMDASVSQTYNYDALSRLTGQSLTGNTMALAYDGVGNRTSRSDNGASASYTYQPASHRLLSVVSGSLTRNFSVSGTGLTTAWTGADGVANAMAYDAYQRPQSHTRNGFTTTYRYNALDQRVLKNSGGGNSTRYVYAGQNTLLAERFTAGNGTGSQWTTHLYLGGQPVGVVKGNTLYWVSADHLGRPDVVTNAAKQVVWRANNWAFNRGIALDQIGGYNLGFPGQYYDSESNLWQNGFRDYEPTIGRYMQSDPIGLMGGISTYGYVGQNPVNYIDKKGLQDATTDFLRDATIRWYVRHMIRNIYNRPPPNLATVRQLAQHGQWRQMEPWRSREHMQGPNGAGNTKWVSCPDGHHEAVYDKDGNLVTDQVNGGTYNYASPYTEPVDHVLEDWLPYKLFGNGPIVFDEDH